MHVGKSCFTTSHVENGALAADILRKSGGARKTEKRSTAENLHFARDILQKMRCSQYLLHIAFEAFQDEEMRAQKGPQDGSKSALKAAENDDFARDILKKMNKFNHIVLKTAVLISSWNRS